MIFTSANFVKDEVMTSTSGSICSPRATGLVTVRFLKLNFGLKLDVDLALLSFCCFIEDLITAK